MLTSMAALQARGKKAGDAIFGANRAAVEAAARVGKEFVTNATIGAILDESEKLVCLPTVKKYISHFRWKKLSVMRLLPDFLTS